MNVQKQLAKATKGMLNQITAFENISKEAKHQADTLKKEAEEKLKDASEVSVAGDKAGKIANNFKALMEETD